MENIDKEEKEYENNAKKIYGLYINEFRNLIKDECAVIGLMDSIKKFLYPDIHKKIKFLNLEKAHVFICLRYIEGCYTSKLVKYFWIFIVFKPFNMDYNTYYHQVENHFDINITFELLEKYGLNNIDKLLVLNRLKRLKIPEKILEDENV